MTILTGLYVDLKSFASNRAEIVVGLAMILARVLLSHLEEHQLGPSLVLVGRPTHEQLIVFEPFDFSHRLGLIAAFE